MSYIIEESLRRLKRLNESEDGSLKKIPDDYFEKLDPHGTCSCENGEDPRNLHNEAIIYCDDGYWGSDDTFYDFKEEGNNTKVIAYKIEYTELGMEYLEELRCGSGRPEDAYWEGGWCYTIPEKNITKVTPGIVTIEAYPSRKFLSFEPANTFTAENGETYDLRNISDTNKWDIVYAAEQKIPYILENSNLSDEFQDYS